MPSGFLFMEEAAEADIPGLLDVERRSASHPWTERHFREAMEAGHRTRTLVIRCLDTEAGLARVIAFCAVRRVVDEVHVENLAVEPEHRGLGLGRLLLRVALAGAIRDGARTGLLEVRVGNQRARRLYESEGFRPIGKRSGYYSEPTEDAVVLSRTL